MGTVNDVKMHNSETELSKLGSYTTTATVEIEKDTVGIPRGPLKDAAEFTLQQTDNISIGEIGIQRGRLG